MADPTWWKRPSLNEKRFGNLTFEEIEGSEQAAELLARRAALEAGPIVPLDVVGRFDPPAPDQVLLHLSVGIAGELVALWCAEADEHLFVGTNSSRRYMVPGYGSASRPAPMIITVHAADGSKTNEVRIPSVQLTYPLVSAAPGGRFAIVSAMCVLWDHAPDQNGILVDAHGTVLDRVMLGDGVNKVQATSSGVTWVGYSDTGILGNNGWGSTGNNTSARRTPIGSLGLVRFDGTYSPEWEYGRTRGETKRPEAEIIDHVYALNVIDETAWLYYYAKNAIARVVDDTITIWNTDVELAHHLVIGEHRVALVGGYGPDYDRVIIGHLTETDLLRETTGRIVLPDGTDLPVPTRATALGATLHVIAGSHWYRLTL